MRKIYLVDINKIDFTYMDKDMETIGFTMFKSYPIVSDEIVMDISSILKFKKAIDDMFELKRKKEKLRKEKKEKEIIEKKNND